MKKDNSVITQMILGNRGSIENMRRSNEWREALKVSAKKLDEFEKQLKLYPELLALYNEFQDAEGIAEAILIEDVYKEAFTFGLAMGQEVFDNK